MLDLMPGPLPAREALPCQGEPPTIGWGQGGIYLNSDSILTGMQSINARQTQSTVDQGVATLVDKRRGFIY